MLKNGVIDCFHNVKMTLINFSIYFNHLNHFYNCLNDGRHLCVTFHAVRGRFQHVPRPFSACSRSFNWSLGPENESPRRLLRFGMRRFFVARLVPEISYFEIWVDFMLTSRQYRERNIYLGIHATSPQDSLLYLDRFLTLITEGAAIAAI